ncbi:MAG TPA: DUF4351 domain-containing protein [Polyangiales bacterium]|jgi:hypothetical protein|nr:DUF4351 domain-containing protein [Polyangiales bacterium]
MPSQLHEVLITLFRNRPTLAPGLLAALHVELPAFSEARVESAELTEVQPAEYRADLVVKLDDGKPVQGIVVEVQLARDDEKQYSWPVYAVGLRARMRCPVCLLVVTQDDLVAAWARRPIDLGGGNVFQPIAIGPAGVPEIVDESRAKAEPELAILSVLAHGRDADVEKAVTIARVAVDAARGLDPDRARMYVDQVLSALGREAKERLKAMDPAKYEYQSEEFKGAVAKGKAEGATEGRAAILLKLLTLKFGPLAPEVIERVRNASADTLDLWAERILSASALHEVLG